MKKIMFNDIYGLTDAVLEGRKTMTRRIVPGGTPLGNWSETAKHSKDQQGEEVAVAQNYEQAGWNPDTLQQAFVKKPTIFPDLDEYKPLCGWVDLPLKYHKGWTNKMFVLNDLMPHRIRITGIKLEWLQDIREEDCLREGIKKMEGGVPYRFEENGKIHLSADPRMLFADLIDRISGRGTWNRNPLVYVYEFELVR